MCCECECSGNRIPAGEVKPLIVKRTREVIEASERVFRTTHKREINSEERNSFRVPPERPPRIAESDKERQFRFRRQR